MLLTHVTLLLMLRTSFASCMKDLGSRQRAREAYLAGSWTLISHFLDPASLLHFTLEVHYVMRVSHLESPARFTRAQRKFLSGSLTGLLSMQSDSRDLHLLSMLLDASLLAHAQDRAHRPRCIRCRQDAVHCALSSLLCAARAPVSAALVSGQRPAESSMGSVAMVKPRRAPGPVLWSAFCARTSGPEKQRRRPQGEGGFWLETACYHQADSAGAASAEGVSQGGDRRVESEVKVAQTTDLSR